MHRAERSPDDWYGEDHHASRSIRIREIVRQNATLDTIREALRELADRQTVDFAIQWEVLDFVDHQLDRRCDLASVFTITGDSETAYGATCEEYVGWQWGQSGLHFLRSMIKLIERRLRGDDPSTQITESSAGLELDLDVNRTQCSGRMFNLRAGFDDGVHAIQVLAWLASVFRIPVKGPPQCSKSMLDLDMEHHTLSLSLSDLEPGRQAEASCWHALVPNTIVATGFPGRMPQVPGLHLGLDVMFDLADILFKTDLATIDPVPDGRPNRGIFYTGAGKLLYPSSSDDRNKVITWHFVQSQGATVPPAGAFLPISSERSLGESRHVVGYARFCEVNLGTGSRSRVYPRMKPSAEPIEQGRPSLTPDTIAAQFGKPPMIVALGGKMTYSKALRAVANPEKRRYDQILRTAERSPTILYDCGSERIGWLVSQLSVILDLLHYYQWQRNQSHLSRLHEASPKPDGGAAARFALDHPPACYQPVEYRYEDRTYVTVLDFVKEVYCKMAQRHILEELPARGLFRLYHERLYGWDLLELLNPPTNADRHEATVHRTTSRAVAQYPSWFELTRHTSVYFCQNLGEVVTCEPSLPLKLIDSPEKCLLANIHAILPLLKTKPRCQDWHLHCDLVWESPCRSFPKVTEYRMLKEDIIDIYTKRFTRTRKHRCATRRNGLRLDDEETDGLVIFGPEEKGLAGKANDVVDGISRRTKGSRVSSRRSFSRPRQLSLDYESA